MIDLTLIIVNWNTRQLLLDCLESVFQDIARTPRRQIDVIVVDNASTDDSAAVLRKQYAQVTLIENESNIGFAAANNQGIRCSKSDYVYLLNSDTILGEHALQAMLDYADSHPSVGALGAQLKNPDGSLQVSASPAPTLVRELWRLFHLDTIKPLAIYPMQAWPQDQARPVDTILGASMLIRKKALDASGLMDEAYFMYSEEVDLCLQLRRHGWEIHWLPEATVLHYGGQSTRQASKAMFLHLYAGKVRYFRKNHGRLDAVLYKAILAAAAIARLIFSPLLWVQRSPRRSRRWQRVQNYRHLLGALPGW
jgi:hypothetical protein